MREHNAVRSGARTAGPFVLAAGILLSACSEPDVTGPAGFSAVPNTHAQEYSGRYLLRYIDDFDNDIVSYDDILELDDGTTLELRFNGRGPELRPGARIRLRGNRQGNTVIVEDATVETVPAGDAAADATASVNMAPVTRRVAIVLFNFSNNTAQPYTPAQAAGIAFTNSNSVAAYYLSNSWNSVTLVGDVYGWFTIPDTNAGSCNYSTWSTSANQLVAAAGIDLSSARYEHVVYAFPSTSSCSFSGVGELPGRRSWLNGGGMSLRTLAHELGHNFGSHHASTWNCIEDGERVPVSLVASNCTYNEYGDPFSIMGASTRRNTNASLANFGWLPAANRQDVTTSGDYRLAPIYSADGIQSIRILHAPATYLTLEFRQPGPFDAFNAGDPVVNGVSIRITGGDLNRTRSRLVDLTPATTSFNDAALAVGNTFADPQTGVSITTLAVSPAGADVRVTFAPDTNPPTQPGNLTATPLDPSRISLSWSASSDNIGVAGYRVFRGSVLVGTVTGTSYADTGLTPSTSYSYQVVAFDAAGNTSPPASATATTPTPDVTPPSAPTGLTASVGKGRKVTLSWNASTDNVGVTGYQVYRDGRLLTTVPGLNHTDTLPGGKNPSATYHIVAVDAAGNVGPPSVSLTVRG